MEDDDEETKTFPPWVALEYRHMRMLAGKESTVYFAHLSSSSASSLSTTLNVEPTPGSDLSSMSATSSGILDLMKQQNVPLDRVCLLDPKAAEELSPSDGEGTFDWFLFGGILGDDPPRDRTSELRALGFPTRHLGPIQMTTDTALGVTKIVVEDKVPLRSIDYIDHPTIRFNSKESVEMPFRYIRKDGEPLLPPGMREHLLEDLNKSFEF